MVSSVHARDLRVPLRWTLAAAVMASGCGSVRDEDGAFGSGVDGATGVDEGTAADDSGGTTRADDAADDSLDESAGPIYDVFVPDPDDIPSGCQKVDLLFVIDNSESMQTYQSNLVASFPGFIEGIQTELAGGHDVHIGVITSDASQNNAPQCRRMGALVTATAGQYSSAQDCAPFDNGARYLDLQQSDLAAKFQCIAQVGTAGSNAEAPMQALVTATAPTQIDSCNDGFLRDDALLVIVLITDEEDDAGGSSGEPAGWAAAVASAKGGIESNVAVVELVRVDPNVCLYKSTEDGSPRLHAFAQAFTHHFIGDMCLPDYSPVLADALAELVDACDGFVPPG